MLYMILKKKSGFFDDECMKNDDYDEEDEL